MKNVKLPILGLSLVLLTTSCKKEAFNEESAIEVAAPETALNAADTIGWKSATQWETADQETFSVRYVTLEDANITADIADNGLVLLFKKSGNEINALPFEEASATTTTDEPANANYWYHQVSEGSLLISCDVYAANATQNAANSFKYFIITPEKLQSLQTEGHTTEELLGLSYNDANALLNTSAN